MRRKNRVDKAIDDRTDAAFRLMCSGIQINILDISKVFAEGRRLQAASADADVLRAGIFVFVRKLAGLDQLTKEQA